jgi:hypothetical protein
MFFFINVPEIKFNNGDGLLCYFDTTKGKYIIENSKTEYLIRALCRYA